MQNKSGTLFRFGKASSLGGRGRPSHENPAGEGTCPHVAIGHLRSSVIRGEKLPPRSRGFLLPHPLADFENHLAGLLVGVDDEVVAVQHRAVEDLERQRVLHQLLEMKPCPSRFARRSETGATRAFPKSAVARAGRASLHLRGRGRLRLAQGRSAPHNPRKNTKAPVISRGLETLALNAVCQTPL